ncbi:hypothetical protein [Glycomyces sp. NPDC048151]|uniref:hypothetical protein n=1 Tax=Glycomyces sp. NPDC048151 TaxID=3364002 RepID=UPI00371F952A
MRKLSTDRSGNWPPEPRLSRGIAFAVVFVVFATCGVGLRLRDRTEPPGTVTYGDIVRPDLQGPLPTATDIDAWKSAFIGFALQWPESEVLQTERPGTLLTFDDEFDSYLAGTAEVQGTDLTAVIGFEDDAVAWFTCYAIGPRTDSAEEFLRTCWEGAAVTGADQVAGAAWVDEYLEIEADDLVVRTDRVCPAFLMLTAVNPNPSIINAQITIAASENC